MLYASVVCPPDPAAFSGVFSSVESRKRAFLNTASQCAQAGISFCPLVIEAVGGGWSDFLRSVVAWIASESNRCSPVRHSDASFKIAKRISCTLHMENGRAILKRAPEQSWSHCCSLGLSLLSESVQLIDSPLNPVSWPWFLGEGLLPSLYGSSSVALSHNFQAFVDPCFQVPPVSSVFFPFALTSFTRFGPRRWSLLSFSSPVLVDFLYLLCFQLFSVPSSLISWSPNVRLRMTICA